MELRHLECFVRTVESGSTDRAAADLGLSTTDLMRIISSLEQELCTPLLQDPVGSSIAPTDAGIRFFRDAQLTLRHAEMAVRASRDTVLSGTVKVGFPPAAAAVLGLPLMRSMRERYPDVQLNLVESLSGHLADLLVTRHLDLAVLYSSSALPQGRWTVTPLAVERLFFIQSADRPVLESLPQRLGLQTLRGVPLILPSASFELRNLLDAAFHRARFQPNISSEIDSLGLIFDAVEAGFGATVQAWSGMCRHRDYAARFRFAEILAAEAQRICTICSLPNEDLSPAAMATRVILAVSARELIRSGAWQGAQES